MQQNSFWRFARVAFFLTVATWQGALETRGIEPQLTNCTLQIGTEVLKPVEVSSTLKTTYRAGSNQFSVFENKVECLVAGGTNALWTARADDGLSLNWLAADEHIAFLGGYKKDRDGRFEGYESPPRVSRLDLAAGKWLPDLPINKGTPSGYVCRSLLGVLTDSGGVIVLTGLVKKSATDPDDKNLDAYGLSLFKNGAASPAWSKLFLATNERPYTGGYLWGVPPPLYAGSDLQRLSWMGDRLLLCAEAMQPVYCLNPDTGSEIWRQERLWEFQRGFIGPSVWSHYITRFGIEEFDTKAESISELRKKFDQQYQCSLAGGPVSVKLDFTRGNDSHSVFLAAVKGPAGRWAGYLSDCVLYELGDNGKPISMLTLPQAPEGSRFCVRDGGVIWKCQNETFIKITPSRRILEVGMGPGGPDGLSDLTWSRRVQYQEPKAWFVSGKAGDPVAFGENYVFCIPAGGYVLRNADNNYHFPISNVNLSTGLDSALCLNVPFSGLFPLPTANYSQEGGPSGFTRSINWHLIGITGLAADHNELDITVATETQTSVVKFDLGAVLKKSEATINRGLGDPMTAARGRAKQVNTNSLNDELYTAAGGTDAPFVKALLEAGANPKDSSALGWTALMVAAAEGTAETVDILIAAGSDLNAADKNCGGQTVLMWAARSNRESKQKVRSLLKAGADPNHTSENGYNALMEAASEGDLETVEYLLASGLKVSARDHTGETVLMAGARSGAANVVSALIGTGADINAKDDEGMTALMRATEAANSVGAVETLLKAGADPNAKDKGGRTALQIAEKSSTFGAEQVRKLLEPVTATK